MTIKMFTSNVNVKNQLSQKDMKRLKGGDGQTSALEPIPPTIYIKE